MAMNMCLVLFEIAFPSDGFVYGLNASVSLFCTGVIRVNMRQDGAMSSWTGRWLFGQEDVRSRRMFNCAFEDDSRGPTAVFLCSLNFLFLFSMYLDEFRM